uniref:Fatty-acid and retinol-binding protein 1 n=1 Tax=Ascaris lumbricoides TaxID=6252 RepID=A0A0M3IFG1_ASCLU
MRVFFVVLAIGWIICAASSRPARSDLTSLAVELLEFIPSSFLTFFGDLNDTDRSALLELSRNVSRNRLTAENEKEFLKELKAKSENAYTKVMGVQSYLQNKVENLKPDSKEFTKKLSDKYLSLFMNSQNAPKGTFSKLKIFVNETFKMFDELSEEGKSDLRSSFSEITQLLANPRFRDYLRRVFESNEVKRAFNRADRAFNPK